MPQGLQAFNIARIIVLLSEKLPETVNGVTMSRYCASSLDSIRHAANAVARRPGRRLHRRRRRVGEPLQRAHRAGRRRRPEREAAGQGRDPNAYIAMGITAVTWPSATRSAAPTWTSTRSARRSSPCSPRRTASSTARSSRSSFPTAPRSTKDDGPRASSTLEKLSELPEAFEGGGGVTAGNSCPLNDGAAAVLVMSDDQGEGARPEAAGADRHGRHARQRAGVHGRRADRRDQEGARPRPE